MPLKIVVTLNRIALCWPCSISPDADHASRYFLSACSFSRTCSSCLDLQTLLTALYLAIYLRLWQHYLNYNVLPKALTTLTILHCSMSMTTLASIHQYIHTSISPSITTATAIYHYCYYQCLYHNISHCCTGSAIAGSITTNHWLSSHDASFPILWNHCMRCVVPLHVKVCSCLWLTCFNRVTYSPLIYQLQLCCHLPLPMSTTIVSISPTGSALYHHQLNHWPSSHDVLTQSH